MFDINTSDSLNPVFLKELRQNFSNRSFRIIMLIVLLLEVLMIISLYSVNIFDLNHIQLEDFEQRLDGFLYFSNAVSIVLATILMTIRWNQEAGVESLDPALCTPFSPFRIVLGRTLSSWLLCLSLLAITLPLLIIMLYSNNIKLSDYVVFISWLIMFVQVMIFGGSIPQKDKKIKSIPVLVILYVIFGNLLLVSFLSSDSISRPGFVILMLAIAALAFLSTVMAIMPYVWNIAKPLKTGLICTGLIITSLYWLDAKCGPELSGYWLLIIGGLTMLGAAAERLDPTFRMQLDSPANPLLRFLNIFISSGAIPGLFLGALLCGGGVVILYQHYNLLLFLIFFAFYAETVILLRIYMKMQFTPALVTTLCFNYFPAVFTCFYELKWFTLLTPFGSITPIRLYIGLALLAVTTIALLPQIIKTFVVYMEKPKNKIF